MKIKAIEKELYNNEEFLKCLPLLKEENWKKSTTKEKLNVFKVIQKSITKVDDYFPSEVCKNKEIFYDVPNQHVLVCQDAIVIDEAILSKSINPYSAISNYMFELAIDRNLSVCDNVTSIKNIKSEKEKMFFVNVTTSMFGEWTNFFERESEDFYFQPITNEASKDARHFTYDLLRYMHKKYGMDNFIGEQASNLMIGSFENERKEKKVNDNYKIMLERYTKVSEEAKQLNDLMEYCEEHMDDINDEFVYSLFNGYVFYNLDDEFRLVLCKWFCKETLKGYEQLDELLDSIDIYENSEGNNILKINGLEIQIDEGLEMNFMMEYVTTLKIQEGLVSEISNKKLIKDAKKCYEFLSLLKDENNEVCCKYMSNAYPFSECQTLLVNYYVDLINKCIAKNPIFSNGTSIISKRDDSKFQAFIEFAFDKNYEEIRELQYKELKEKATKKKV